MKLYWRCKINGKWTYIAAVIEDHLFNQVFDEGCEQREYWYIPEPDLKKELKE
jgi:hypothetical protein